MAGRQDRNSQVFPRRIAIDDTAASKMLSVYQKLGYGAKNFKGEVSIV